MQLLLIPCSFKLVASLSENPGKDVFSETQSAHEPTSQHLFSEKAPYIIDIASLRLAIITEHLK